MNDTISNNKGRIARLSMIPTGCLGGLGIGLALFIGTAVAVMLYQGNRSAAAFTARLDALAQQGPEVVIADADEERDEHVVSEDVKAILSVYQKNNEAWCKADGEAYASVFTRDADFISFDGTHTIGRREIASSHQDLFDTFLQNTCIVGQITRIKFLNENTAVVYVVSGTRFDGNREVRRPSIQTYVAVKQRDNWLFSAFHNGRIDRIEERNILRKMWLGIETVVLRR